MVAKAATPTIPIVVSSTSDPVGIGLVASLNRPGGNVTGMSSSNTELGAKRLGLLHQLVPATSEIANIINPNYPTAETEKMQVELAAQLKRRDSRRSPWRRRG